MSLLLMVLLSTAIGGSAATAAFCFSLRHYSLAKLNLGLAALNFGMLLYTWPVAA